MDDLISRKATIDALNNVLADYIPCLIGRNEEIPLKCAVAIRDLPSAQPEIVRCKDCKFYTSMNRETKSGICNLMLHQNFGDDWFCAGAERRTDEESD